VFLAQLAKRCLMPASYACFPEKSRGRLRDEQIDPYRTCFQRDRDRIIHSTAFRRLEYKTQVFVYHEGDHYRTRLTHSLEVGQLARAVARMLGLDEDLSEAVALAHDLGHTPFGHAGEDALDAVMQPFGGFDHNAQTIRILTQLETQYAAFDGLNLTWETLEGIAKHNGPVASPPRALLAFQAIWDLELAGFPSLEAQIASLADDIAYLNHDIEDGLRAGLFRIEQIMSLPMVGEAFMEVASRHPLIADARLIHEGKRSMITKMVRNLVHETERRIQQFGVETVADIRASQQMIAGFSPMMMEAIGAVRAFLFEHMYQHYQVNRMTSKARRVVSDLFRFFHEDPACLPTEWRQLAEAARGMDDRAEVIADYIAGMTDRYALLEHQRLFDLYYGRLIARD
jgi:dGTPase